MTRDIDAIIRPAEHKRAMNRARVPRHRSRSELLGAEFVFLYESGAGYFPIRRLQLLVGMPLFLPARLKRGFRTFILKNPTSVVSPIKDGAKPYALDRHVKSIGMTFCASASPVPLRSLDGLHLGTALTLNCDTLATGDQRLASSAKKLNLKVLFMQ